MPGTVVVAFNWVPDRGVPTGTAAGVGQVMTGVAGAMVRVPEAEPL